MTSTETIFPEEIFQLGERALGRQEQRTLDHYWVEKSGLPLLLLMEQAAAAAFHFLRLQVLHSESKILLLAGPGMNGGDAWALARQLLSFSPRISVIDFCPQKSLGKEAETMRAAAFRMGLPIFPAEESADFWSGLERPDFIIEGMLGTGFTLERPLSAAMVQASVQLKMWQKQGSRVISLDLPAGVESTSGGVDPAVVQADLTLSFVLAKTGLCNMPGAAFAGRIEVLPIGLPLTEETLALSENHLRLINLAMAKALLPHENNFGHKGERGRLALFAGCPEMPGGLRLCLEAALVTGPGYLYLSTDKELEPSIICDFPETITGQDAAAAATVIAAGPAWGQRRSRMTKLLELIEGNKPLVLDADAINVLATFPDAVSLLRKRAERLGEGSVLLTPHPGEAARLCPDLLPRMKHDRVETAREMAARFAAVVLLKGACTVIALPDGRAFVLPIASAALSRAGSGDVLTGLISGFAARGMSLAMAAVLGAYVHGKAAVQAASEKGSASVRSADLALYAARVIRQLGS